MKLREFRTQFPVQLFGEDGSSAQSFVVDANVGKGKVTGIEATPIGVIVYREAVAGTANVDDLIIVGPGSGIPLEKRKQEPAQLKGAR